MTDQLLNRIQACSEQQFVPGNVRRQIDPLTGRACYITAGRSRRHTEGDATGRLERAQQDCFFCNYRTTSTLFEIDPELNVVPAEETASLEAAQRWLEGRDRARADTFYELVDHLAEFNRPAHPSLVRNFLNLTPGLGHKGLCVVTSLPPEHHDSALADLPTEVVAAIFRSWQHIEAELAAHPYALVPFVNGGRHRASGQSVACPHAQIYIPQHTPALYEAMEIRRQDTHFSRCPLCTLSRRAETEGLLICQQDGFKAIAHPAPERSWSLLIIPDNHDSTLTAHPAPAFAHLLKQSLQALTEALSTEPAWNLALRTGKHIAHTHAELVPKTTGIPAAFEIAAGEWIIDADPVDVAAALRAALSAE